MRVMGGDIEARLPTQRWPLSPRQTARDVASVRREGRSTDGSGDRFPIGQDLCTRGTEGARCGQEGQESQARRDPPPAAKAIERREGLIYKHLLSTPTIWLRTLPYSFAWEASPSTDEAKNFRNFLTRAAEV